MLFTSLEFAFFLPIVFFVYWVILGKKVKAQNFFIVLSSYFFYGWWDYRFLYLIILSSLVDYFLSKFISETKSARKKKIALISSISINLGFLFFFKYFNFFLETFQDSFTFFGSSLSVERLSIILPVGISFYTFQTLSYTIDVYKGKLEPAKNLVSFLAYVSFFPQLVAGPIERATNLLPQFYTIRVFHRNEVILGLRQILWGLSKKIIIADSCAVFVNQIFTNYESYNSSTLIIGAILFAFQIYGDFSGYSDIAIGTARLFGFNLMRNFSYPYFSRDIGEFWRKWHISLTTWFRDYLYIPLGGSRVSTLKKIRNIMIIFIVSGLWHGANWTFIIWGFLNALYFLPLSFGSLNNKNPDTCTNSKLLPSLLELVKIITTFTLTTLAWVVFRSETVYDAFKYLNKIIFNNPLSKPNFLDLNLVIKTLIMVAVMLVIEWVNKTNNFPLEKFQGPKLLRWSIYCLMILLIISYSDKPQDFIYFQF